MLANFKKESFPYLLIYESGSKFSGKFKKKIFKSDFTKGNNLSAALIAAFCPLTSPSKQIIGFLKNLHINSICFSVIAVPRFATTF